MASLLPKVIRDGLQNLVANLGTARDKATHTQYGLPLLTADQADNAYRGAWLPRKIVDIPALDAARNWRSWNAEADQVSAIEAEEKRLGVQLRLLNAHVKARLHGGAALYIGTGQSNPEQPLRPETIQLGGLRHLNVLTKKVLKAGDRELDPESPLYGQPAFYTLTSGSGQVRIHPSRLVVLHGAGEPDPDSASQFDGWGDSVLLAVMEAIRNADSTSANVASLVFEAKVDVLRIPDFMANLSDETYENQLLRRFQLAAMAKGINGMLVLDKDEEYEQKSANFTNLTDILMAFMQLVSGAADIPMTRLLGQSPGGLNASGDSDIRNYYDRIRSMQELKIAPAMEVLDECLIRSALGSRPPEVFYNWRSLWQTTDKERADIGKITAETIKLIDDTGLVPDEVMGKIAQNMLTESGVAPGLESAMDEYLAAGGDPLDGRGDDNAADELAAATTGKPPVPGSEILADAKPRTLYVHRKVKNGAEILAWAKAQGFETTLPADDLHVTIAFSRQPVDWMKAGSSWSDREDGGVSVRPGGARLIEKFDGGAVVLLFNSSELSWRHEAIKEAGASWDWPEYQPHITVTYDVGAVDLSKVEPYRGAIELGPEVFEELDLDWKSKVRED